MSLQEALASGRFVITSEVGPPKGTDMGPAVEGAALCRDCVDAFAVTDNQASVMKMDPVVACLRLQQAGLSPVLQITCRDRNRLALQSLLLSAHNLGLSEIVCLTGDHVVLGDDQEAMPVFDIDSVHLLKAVQGLMAGRDMADNELEGDPPQFFAGCVASPGSLPMEPQVLKLEKKVAAGAQFVLTQAIYDMDVLAEFMRAVRHLDVPIIGGFVVLKSARMAAFMNKHTAGVTVPDHLIAELDACTSREERRAKAIDIAARLVTGIREHCRGVHIMSLGWDHHIPAILDAAAL